MASPKKLAANRANASAGTGPRTAVGRARSAGNARRHGLNVPVLSDRWLSAEAEALAHEIAGPNAEPEIIHLARRIAEAQIDLVRVRQRRQDLLSNSLSINRYVPQKLLTKGLKFVLDTRRPDRTSIGRRQRTANARSTGRSALRGAALHRQERAVARAVI